MQEAEGFRLHLNAESSTGYRGVAFMPRQKCKQFKAREGKVYLGCFATAVEAAVRYARHVQQKEPSAMEEEQQAQEEQQEQQQEQQQGRA